MSEEQKIQRLKLLNWYADWHGLNAYEEAKIGESEATLAGILLLARELK